LSGAGRPARLKESEMRPRFALIAFTAGAAALAVAVVCAQQPAPPRQYPFQDPKLPIEQRVNNIVSLLTLDEKISCLGTNPSVARLGIRGTGHSEGLHGLALGGPGGWGRGRELGRCLIRVPV